MKKYLFLSSAFLMTMAGANAADKMITSANTCTVDVLGVYENDAVANTIATWDLIDYTLDPGEYLNVTDTSVTETTCPAGSYCVGGGYTVETANNSIAQCPTGYPNSANGASADTQCYTTCTVATANIAHATAVSGNDYYGTGVDTCGATACETGYHVDGSGIELVEKDPLIPVDYTLAGNDSDFINADGNAPTQTIKYGLTANNTWAVEFDYGTVYGKASCQPKIDPALEYIHNNQSALIGGQMSLEDFLTGLEPLTGPVKTEYIKNTFIGYATGAISEEELYKRAFGVFYMEPNANYATNSTGQHCYCQMDGFTPTGGTKQTVTSAPWVFYWSEDKASTCASDCSNRCAANLRTDGVIKLALRAAVFGALDYTQTGICAANTINIDWNPDNGGDHIKNMCTYEGAITLPTPDPVKPGYTFTGWKLVEENK